MKVAKFGGSSLSNASQFKKVKRIIESDPTRQIVVVSALGKRHSEDDKITDLLYILYAHMKHQVNYEDIWETFATRFIEVRDLLQLNYPIEKDLAALKAEIQLQKVTEDYLVSRGEYLTAKLIAEYLHYTFVDAKDLITFDYDGKFFFEIIEKKVAATLKAKTHVVVPGFYGAYASGEIKIMSRGGSDITGSLLAAGSHAEVYENWTDVSGILMTDPKIVSKPKTIENLTYSELRELSYMGASVLHEAAILPLQKADIPLNIKNTNAPEDLGTFMRKQRRTTSEKITGIAGKKDFISLLLYKEKMSSEVGFLSKAMKIFEDFQLSIEHVPTGIDHIGIVVSYEKVAPRLYELLGVLKETLQLDKIELMKDLALIAVVGEQMKGNLEVVSQVFHALSQAKIPTPLISQSPQQMSLIIGLPNKDYETAVKVLYKELVANESK